LNYIKDHIIIKKKQLDCLYEIEKLVHIPNKNEKKEELCNLCSLQNTKKNFHLDFSNRINIEYIQGLFDAEGCIYIDKNYKRVCISISQKNHPIILYEIQKFLGFGKIENNTAFIIYKKSDCLQFALFMKSGSIVKYKQLQALETYLTTSDNNIKKEMYTICNEEKHKIEYFTNINQNESEKDGFFEMCLWKKCKENICSEIKRKQAYKVKSEKMTGEGNHNFGKSFSEETRKKMSLSIRYAKDGISDETIKKVRDMIHGGVLNIDIQKKLNLPRHTITRIKNQTLVCRMEDKPEKKSKTQEEVNISKRKIFIDEILIVIDKCIDGDKPSTILRFVEDRRKEKNIENTLTIDIVKNIKRNIQQGKLPFYEFEVSKEIYNLYLGKVSNPTIQN
jgi:hypothetical protein